MTVKRKPHIITVPGLVICCDACDKEGAEVGHEDLADLYAYAEMDGWLIDELDICPACQPKKPKRREKVAAPKAPREKAR